MPVMQKIDVLLALEYFGRDAGQRLYDLWRKVIEQHHVEIGFGQETQAVAACAFDELVNLERFVDLFEMIVQHIVIALAPHDLRLQSQHHGVRRVGAVHRLREEIERRRAWSTRLRASGNWRV
jgi:hypothetical protein